MNETQLPWPLIGFGAFIVALMIFLWTIRSRISQGIRSRRRRPEQEPVLGESMAPFTSDRHLVHEFGDLGYISPDHHLADKALVNVEVLPIHRDREIPSGNLDVPSEEAECLNQTQDQSLNPLDSSPQITVALTVIAPPHQPFPGALIKTVAEDLNFLLGENDLFEHYPEDDPNAQTPVFSMAHLREPGSFNLRAMTELTTPGLLLFMKLPGPVEGTQALNRLVYTADQLAQRLGGAICDSQRKRMTNATLLRMQQDIGNFEQRLRTTPQPV